MSKKKALAASQKAEPPKKTPRGTAWILAAVLIIALGVRTTGLAWGLSNHFRFYSPHPDENTIISYALLNPFLNVPHGQLFPHFYNYGSLQLFIINFLGSVAFVHGWITLSPSAQIPGYFPNLCGQCLLLARSATVLMGVGAVWTTYALGNRLFGKAAGLLAALFLAVCPLHMQHSHFATVDVPSGFWTALSLVWAAKILPALNEKSFDEGRKKTKSFSLASLKEKKLAAFLLSGAFAGLAAATKYNCALAVLGLLAAGHSLAWGKERGGRSIIEKIEIAVNAALGLLSSAFFFILGCPGSIFDNQFFSYSLNYESQHVYHQPEVYFQNTGLGCWYIVTNNLVVALGLPLLFCCLVGIGWAVWKRSSRDLLLGSFTLAYFILISLASSRYARYEIALLPMLVVFAARFLVECWRSANKYLRILSGALAIASVLMSSLLTFVFLAPMASADNRDLAAEAVIASKNQPKSIGFASTPWFWTPPVNPFFSDNKPWGWLDRGPGANWVSSAFVFDRYRPFNVDLLKAQKPDVVFISEIEYKDNLRLGNPDALAYCNYLTKNYRIEVCEPDMPALVHNGLCGLPVSDAPPDMLYVCPVTLKCVRKDLLR